MTLSLTDIKFSVVIPVFNSQDIVAETIDQTVAFFEQQHWHFEIILINDASPDHSWERIREKALADDRIIAINLLKNYGQHTAIYAGLQHATGDYIITMDDDLQNPPQEIEHLVAKILEGYDVVYGRFRSKAHPGYRRLGSRMIALVNRRIFNQPRDLIVSNFRIMRRDVVQRICNYQTHYPYITGLSLMFSTNRANVEVEHHPRKVGSSNYNFVRILSLVSRILFNYSSYPLLWVSFLGFATTVIAFILGIYIFLRALILGFAVPGWATVVVLISLLSGVNIVISSMLGEYLIRLVKQVTDSKSYYIKEIINHDE